MSLPAAKTVVAAPSARGGWRKRKRGEATA